MKDITAHLSLDRTSPQPLFDQLAQQIRQLIREGRLKAGDAIPGDVALAQALQVNPRTIRQALAGLVEAGLVKRVRKAGTFVTDANRTLRDRIGFYYFDEAALQMERYIPAMRACVQRHKADLYCRVYQRDFFQQVNLLEDVRSQGLRGAIIMPLINQDSQRQLRQLEAAGFPHVRLSNPSPAGALRSPLVKPDWERAYREIYHYFWACGHRRIGAIFTAHQVAARDAWKDFSARHGPFPDRWQLRIPFDGTLKMLYELPVQRMIRQYLQDNSDVSAICASLLAGETITIARQMGRNIPRELAVVGFGYQPAVDGLTVSTLQAVAKGMGETAVYRLFDVIHNGPMDLEDEAIIPFDFIPGDTFSIDMHYRKRRWRKGSARQRKTQEGA